MTVFNADVLFSGYDAAGDTGLWVTDGTAAETHELTGISGANAAGLNPSDNGGLQRRGAVQRLGHRW
jgi:ELWxxDGT repeat protein